MFKLLILLCVATFIFADKVTFMCTPYSTIINGKIKEQSPESDKFVLDTTWYSKPTSLTWYRPSGEIRATFPNIQTKFEWVKSSSSKFQLKHDRGVLTLSLSKSAPYILEMESSETKKNNLGQVKATCIEIN